MSSTLPSGRRSFIDRYGDMISAANYGIDAANLNPISHERFDKWQQTVMRLIQNLKRWPH